MTERKKRTGYGEMRLSERWAACAVGMGTGLLPYMINGYISYFFTDVMLIPAASLVAFMFIARIFDGIQDIGIGIVVDRIRRPDGQCRPFFKWFAFPFFLSSVLLFLNPPLGQTGKLVYAFVMYIMALFMISFLQLPYATQISLLTKDNKEITTISSMRFLTAAVVSVLAGIVFIPLLTLFGGGDKDQGFLFMGAAVGAIGALSAVWQYKGTKDRHIAPLPEKKKVSVLKQLKYLNNIPWLLGLIIVLLVMLSYAFNTSMAIYYFTYVIPNETLAGLAIVIVFAFIVPGSILAPSLSNKTGKKQAVLIGIGISILGKLVMLMGSVPFLFAGLAMTGFGLGTAIPLMTALMPDIVDYGEWKHGVSTPGILYSAVSLGSKAGNGLAVSLALLVLSIGGYDATLPVQPQSALTAITSAYIFVPLTCEVLAFITMNFYRIDKMRDKIQAELAAGRGQA